MKKLILLLIAVISLGSIFAQSPNKWLDPNTHWHYSIWYFMFQYPTGFNHYYYAQDTIINNIPFQQVKAEQQLRYDNGNGTFTIGGTTFLGNMHFITSNDTVYLLTASNTLQFLWYNNPIVGDIWEYGSQWDWFTNTFINAYSMVDSIKFITVNGVQLKEIYSHSVKDLAGTPVQFGDTALYVDYILKINTTFGPVTGFNKIGQFTSNLIIDETTTDDLLCFESDSFPFYQVNPNINCNNNIILGIKENEFLNITISPNPFNSEIKIDKLNSLSEIKFFDINGRLILEKNNQSGVVVIETGSLNNGFYFIQIKLKEGSTINKKIVKLN